VNIDELNGRVADCIIGARPVLGGGGRGSIGTANGCFSKVVNEDCILKELGFSSKQTRSPETKKHQMRGILATRTLVRRRDRTQGYASQAFITPGAPLVPIVLNKLVVWIRHSLSRLPDKRGANVNYAPCAKAVMVS
jgi:hypothetical protein